jgi:hypothetical protein
MTPAATTPHALGEATPDHIRWIRSNVTAETGVTLPVVRDLPDASDSASGAQDVW